MADISLQGRLIIILALPSRFALTPFLGMTDGASLPCREMSAMFLSKGHGIRHLFLQCRTDPMGIMTEGAETVNIGVS